MEGFVSVPGFKDGHCQAGTDCGDEEEDRFERGVPERVELSRHDQIKATKGRLMESGEDHTGDDQRNHDGVQPFKLAMPAEAFQDHGQKFEHEHGGVEHHAPGNFKHDGVVIPHHEGMPDAVGASKIKDEGSDEHGIAEKRGEDHGAKNGSIAFQVEDVDDSGESESTTGKCNGEELKTNPETPRKIIGEVGGLAKAVGKAVDQRVEAGDED